MVQGIIIPADNTAPLRTDALDSLEDFQRAVGGWIEAVDIPDLGVTMYVNEEGLIRDLPFNRRATFLWRFNVPEARDARLVEDVAVVGLTDDEGESTDLPSEIRQRLLEPGVYRVRSRELDGNRWHEEPVYRDDYFETVIWAALLQEMSRALEVEIERVEACSDEGEQPRRKRRPLCMVAASSLAELEITPQPSTLHRSPGRRSAPRQ
ncbi:DUF3846 domain-containing protein [Microbacterium sp. KSW2-29]|uniref:DUF3846 domain-containing protein n=1 Tax=Microbacterium phycohabitans TaxID=3075993 RepID=A0ABU3SNQ1_9MICO|nr:DUF3846 domain-containing protein [Microbacterium sp. KSW2-29]MDU0346472.1 DUF3846 domain-containing protein [Microbacterium sp. KSW2-29]